jgi:hypothetical protein
MLSVFGEYLLNSTTFFRLYIYFIYANILQLH